MYVNKFLSVMYKPDFEYFPHFLNNTEKVFKSGWMTALRYSFTFKISFSCLYDKALSCKKRGKKC